MKIAFISDLHIKKVGDKACQTYWSFINSSEVQSCDQIILMGDIFDFLIGEHKQFTKKYAFFFKSIINQLENGKEIIFIEGNHDFHFKNTIEKYLKKHTEKHESFKYLQDGFSIDLNGKTCYICHGDEVDFFNEAFKRWKKIYTSSWFKVMVSYIFTFRILVTLANLASKDSKRRGSKTFDRSKAKAKYLVGASELIKQKSIDIVVAGHTHIQELHTYEDGTQYINIGHPSSSGQSIYWNESKFEIFNLKDS